MASSDYYIADNSDIEDKKLEAAKNHYNMGDYNSALKLYLSLINANISFKLYHRIAKCYYKLGDTKNAEEYFKRSVELEPNENPSYQYLGNIAYKNENLNDAIYNWLKVYSYKPEDENITLNLATSYFSKGMKFQSVFYYEKYLKYASKNADSYTAIQTSIKKCNQVAEEFLQKAKLEISRKKYEAGIEFLTFAVKNSPTNFEINNLLGTIYFNLNDNMHSSAFLKQAFCINNRSVDVIQKLITVYINLGDYTASYCMMKRLIPFLINNQKEYLKILNMTKALEESFNNMSYQGHKTWGDNYYKENNYHLALIEYENCVLLNEDMKAELSGKINEIKKFINPEETLINDCITKGEKYTKEGNARLANNYFTRVMLLSDEKSGEYKLAKSKIV